ncbi:MAG: nucleotidyl transferase AbiEii/AbiGii toxin family protein [Pseudomonadota bacterium]|nr:nucleotidyl transferase AbiEii/AbiGii toxin family protein [Pseudomonadota bacterium]MDE3037560.1 nucleotidyl transferase AbiEii/AbiGii toxin family protein [Pseudomonadota bacterium]
MDKEYRKQAALLLTVLPEVAKETCFAMHGGTAINLFVRDMPRLSVDIDLTYVPIEDRATSLRHIDEALERIKGRIESVVAGARVQHKKDIGKLLISAQGVDIKLEVNLVNRGTIADPVKMKLCARAQSEFNAFAAIPVVPIGQLYGGKICAALDRQHPRDLFDVKYLLANEGFSEDVKKGFLLCLLASDRPIRELITPNFQDQRSVLANQFAGMTTEDFTYDEYEQVRERLTRIVRESLTKRDRDFLLSVKNLTPDWSIHDFERFPSVQWKLLNLRKLRDVSPEKHRAQYEALVTVLNS